MEHGGRLSAADQGDRELVERVRAGDAVAVRLLLRRHRDAVADLPGGDHSSLDATGAAAVAAVRAGEDHDLPFRAVWLALHGPGVLPPPDVARNGTWSAFTALPAAWQGAVWHHLVEGDTAAEVGRHLGTTPERAALALGAAYASFCRRLAMPDPEPALWREELAEEVLGALSTRYLARRPLPPVLPEPRPATGDRSARAVAAFTGVAAAALAVVIALGQQLVPLGINVTERLIEAGAALPGVQLAPLDDESEAPTASPVVPGSVIEPATGSATGGRDGDADGDGDGDGGGDPNPPSPPAPPPPPPPPSPPPPTEPALRVVLPAGLGSVEAGDGGVRLEVDAQVLDPVVVEVPVPLPVDAVRLP